MVSALTSHLQTLHLSELTDSLRLCSKILSKVQPPLLSANTRGVLQFPSGQNNSVKEWEDKKVMFVINFGIRPVVLDLEQHEFELLVSIYVQIFFNKYKIFGDL